MPGDHLKRGPSEFPPVVQSCFQAGGGGNAVPTGAGSAPPLLSGEVGDNRLTSGIQRKEGPGRLQVEVSSGNPLGTVLTEMDPEGVLPFLH